MHKDNRQSQLLIQELASRWANVILSFGLLLVIYTTLFPFEFFGIEDAGLKDLKDHVNFRLVRPEAISDHFRNILLFVPIGFGTAAQLKKRGKSRWAMLVAALIAGLGLTLLIEILQLFIPERQTSISDVLTNVAGAFLGFLLFTLWGTQILNFATVSLRKTAHYLTAKSLTGIIIAYAIITIILSFTILGGTTLSNWNDSFPLILGNEHTGDRPWRGQISELLIADSALSEKSITRILSEDGPESVGGSWLAYYSLTGASEYPDKAGNLPDLNWVGVVPEGEAAADLGFDKSRWLETETPVTSLNQKLRQSSQFTLVTRIATADLDQLGPARIISISGDPFQRNFTLAQEGSDLVLLLRTPITGINGSALEFEVPELFTDTGWQQLVITYNGSALRLYADSLENVHDIEITPEVIIPGSLQLIERWKLRPQIGTANANTIVYNGLIFIPLTFFLSLVAARLNWSSIRVVFIVGGGLLVLALILELGLLIFRKPVIQPLVLFLDLTIVAISYLFIRVRAFPWLQQVLTE